MQPLNLVPVDCLESWNRRRRGVAWLFLCLVAAVATVLAAGQRWNAGRSIARLEKRVAELRARQSDLDRSLVLADGEHGALLSQAEAIASLDQPHDLPKQLAALSDIAPNGVVFTRIDVKTEAPRKPDSNVGPDNGGLAGVNEVATEMSGYAVSHQELDRLINAVQTIAQWRRVRLMRAASEPYLSGQAVAFHLTCVPEERKR